LSNTVVEGKADEVAGVGVLVGAEVGVLVGAETGVLVGVELANSRP